MRVSFNLPDYEHGKEHACCIVSGGIEIGNWGSEPSQVSALTSGSSQMKAYLRMLGTAMLKLACTLLIQYGGFIQNTPTVKFGEEQEKGIRNDKSGTRKWYWRC